MPLAKFKVVTRNNPTLQHFSNLRRRQMKSFLTLNLIIFLSHLSVAQINTELIKKNVTDNPQENFYLLLEIFKTNPTKLTQEQLNQLYYGSKFLKTNSSISDCNSDVKFWKVAKKKLSRIKAEKIINEAETKYLRNPLIKSLLEDMINIYSAVDLREKINICNIQKTMIAKTIEIVEMGKLKKLQSV